MDSYDMERADFGVLETFVNAPQRAIDRQKSDREQMLLDMGLDPDDFAESKIDPAQFEWAGWPNGFQDFQVPSVPCAMCGHFIRWANGFRHLPSNEIIYVGDDCAVYLDSDDIRERERKQWRTKIKNEEEKRAREAEFAARRAQMEQDHPDVIAFLRKKEEDGHLGGFMFDMVFALNRWGSLTERQIEAVEKTMEREAKWEAEQIVPTSPAPEGRVTIEGKVLKTRWQRSDFGEVLKMLVLLDDGNRVWGSVPAKLNVDNGDRVRFTATFNNSNDDEHFSFFKRPTKAEVIEKALLEVEA